MQDTLQPGNVLLGDAFYPTYFFMAAMIDKGVDLVMEQQGARRRSTDFRNIKEAMGMNVLSCKTPEMALKEIWVTLLAYNLIRLLMAQSASLSEVVPHALSFKHCLQLWRTCCQYNTGNELDYLQLFKLMAQQQIGKRPGRIEPRAVKRRPKAYPLLSKPRAEARQQVIQFGHPKKLK